MSVVDDRLNVKEIIEHRFRSAVSSFNPGLVIGVSFAYDENVGIRSFNQLRRFSDFVLYISNVIVRRPCVIAGIEWWQDQSM